MSQRRNIRIAAWTLAMAVGQLQLAFAADQVAQRPLLTTSNADPTMNDLAINDLVMDRSGQVRGRIVTETAVPIPKATLIVRLNGREVARRVTNDAGEYFVSNISGGLYELIVVTPSGNMAQSVFRIWSEQAAPPIARRSADMVVTSAVVVRGNGEHPGYLSYVTQSPWWTAAGITALIATPIALTHDGS